MRILVVDDEVLARKRITKLLNETGQFLAIYEASSGKEAISLINEILPDLVFLDIQMTDMTGFDVLKKIDLKKLPIVIFVTAYDSFALQAFEVQAMDFLLKPYKNSRFYNALSRGFELIKLKEKTVFQSKINKLIEFIDVEKPSVQQHNYLDKIVLKIAKKYYFIKTSQIKYIISAASYVEIFTLNNKKHVYRISMSDFIKKLSPNMFYRVNRSTILNTNQIKEVVSEGLGSFSIVMNDNTSFILTKKYKNDFLKTVNIKL